MKRLLTVYCLLFALLLSGCAHPAGDGSLTNLRFPGDTEAPTSASLPATEPKPISSEMTTTKGVLTTPSTPGQSAPVTTVPVTPASSATASATPETGTSVPTGTESSSTPVVTDPIPTSTTEATVPGPVTTATPTTSTPTTPTPTTSIPATSAPETQARPSLPDPSEEDYREDSSILYAKRALTLYQNGAAIRVEADTALLCTGIGDRFMRVRWQGKTAYVPADDVTKTRPQSAVDLAREKGGIYYKGTGPLIAIDAGHQDHAMREKEPLGPGSDEMKAKLSSGTQGVATRLEEYKLNLAVALLLRDELIGRGYSVVMIRESNNVDMSNAERALIANAYEADAFIRIHANGSENQSAAGAYTLCPTASNPYNGDIYPECKRLSEIILDKYIESTDFKKLSIWYTDTMTGLNWASVPVTLIEMGYMSNPDEDRTMATAEFQKKAALGMADGFDVYFGRE